MAQFTVCRNKNPQTCSAVPFLLDIQNDLLDDLEAQVVGELGAPVARVEQHRFEIISAIDFLVTGI